MNWVTHENTTDWKIESTSKYVAPYYEFYRWSKSFIRVTMKTEGTKSITVNNESYTLYWADEFIIVEITDFIRATESGTMTIDYSSTTYTLNFVSINGEPTILASEREKLPTEIYFSTVADLPFWVEMTVLMVGEDYGNDTIYLNTDNIVQSYDWNTLYTLYYPHLMDSITGVVSNLINNVCWGEMILVEWMSRYGKLKSWWFKIDRIIYGSDKELNLQTMENGYYTMKNKRTNVVIKHLKADNKTQQYLSDLVMSDEVYIYDGNLLSGKLRVKIDENSFAVTKQKRDVQLTINKFAYDTI